MMIVENNVIISISTAASIFTISVNLRRSNFQTMLEGDIVLA